jgi:hypothetical protein
VRTIILPAALMFTILVMALGIEAWQSLSKIAFTPFDQYTQSLKRSLPRVQGKFECTGVNLTFEGSYELRGVWKGKAYNIGYPDIVDVSHDTAICAIGMKPTEDEVIKKIKARQLQVGLDVQQMLLTRQFPATVTPTQEKLLVSLVESLDPAADPSKNDNLNSDTIRQHISGQ